MKYMKEKIENMRDTYQKIQDVTYLAMFYMVTHILSTVASLRSDNVEVRVTMDDAIWEFVK
jgi:hypothetical protein